MIGERLLGRGGERGIVGWRFDEFEEIGPSTGLEALDGGVDDVAISVVDEQSDLEELGR
jgi:hypothetical protein